MFLLISKHLYINLHQYRIMLKAEFVYRELLRQCFEGRKREFTQKGLAAGLRMSLSNVNHAVQPLRRMNAIKVNPRNFRVVSPKKILYYWASNRNLQKDIAYSTRVEAPVREIEKRMPGGSVFTGYSGYWFRFSDAPADYSEVYVYAEDMGEMRTRFPESKKPANLFALQKDELMREYSGVAPIGLLFADLWNMPEWYASDFLKALEARVDAVLE